MIKKLRVGIIIIFGVLTIFSVFSILFVSYKSLVQESTLLFGRYQLSLTQECGGRFADRIKKIYSDMHWLSSSLENASEELQMSLLKEAWRKIGVTEGKMVESLWLIDKNGKGEKVYPESLKSSFIGKDFSYRFYFKVVKRTLKPCISFPFMGKEGKYLTAVVVPLKKEGNFYGVLGLSFFSSILYRKQFLFLRFGKATQIILVDKENRVILSPVDIYGKVSILKRKGETYPLNSRIIKGKIIFARKRKPPLSIISIFPLTLFGNSYKLISFTPYDEALVFPFQSLKFSLIFTFISAGFITLGLYSLWGRMKASDRLYKLSITDGLTNLFNHHHFYKTLPKEIKRVKRYFHPLSLIMLDVDGFKNYNDEHGHLEGDRLLMKIGEVLSDSIRQGIDSAYRYGGDEFAILLPETGLKEAEKIAQRIKGNLLKERVSSSIGIVRWKEGWSERRFVKEADTKLYEAKRRGKGIICISTEE